LKKKAFCKQPPQPQVDTKVDKTNKKNLLTLEADTLGLNNLSPFQRGVGVAANTMSEVCSVNLMLGVS
jgi:hypothetical protein